MSEYYEKYIKYKKKYLEIQTKINEIKNKNKQLGGSNFLNKQNKPKLSNTFSLNKHDKSKPQTNIHKPDKYTSSTNSDKHTSSIKSNKQTSISKSEKEKKFKKNQNNIINFISPHYKYLIENPHILHNHEERENYLFTSFINNQLDNLL